ncbi:MAG TPA: DUF1015 domain-containing protein [Candidatus Dormibacteraeota bacterium]|nr:DUF1015 domain-containing protein [Candidatus Dormibacteraeota bacterium]
MGCPTSTTSSCAEAAIADVRALPGIRYADTSRLTELVTPPYDVIAAGDVAGFEARSPHNFIRLIRPGTDYAGAARRLEEWIASGVLRSDEPSMYVHEVDVRGATRRDLIAAMRLEPYDRGIVLPHERTHRGPKEDRLALLRATGASLEPLWFVFDGAETGVPALLARAAGDAPLAEFDDSEGLRQRLWRVPAGEWTDQVRAALAAAPVLIADGHHRYETTLAYSEEVGGPADAASRFTLALLTDIGDPGLHVAPTHRVLKAGIAVTGGEPAESLEEVLAAIDGRVAAGVYREGRFQVLELEGEMAVVELHRQVIDNLLGRRNPEDLLLYTRDARQAVQWVDEGVGVSAFFLGPPHLRTVLKLAQEGKTLPQKSTYFHPKPPSGMVIHRLDANRTI